MADKLNIISIEGANGSGRTTAAMSIALSPRYEGANVLWLYPTQSHASDALRRYQLSGLHETTPLRGMQFLCSESMLGDMAHALDSIKLVIIDDCELHRPGVIQQLLSEMRKHTGKAFVNVILIRNTFKW